MFRINPRIQRNFDCLRDLHEARTNEQTPGDIFGKLIDAIGLDDAREVIAATVNTIGDWDGRISSANREWAKSTTAEGFDNYISGRDNIHPAHVDQYASIARRAVRDGYMILIDR